MNYYPSSAEEERRNYDNGYKGEAYIYSQLIKSRQYKSVHWEHKSNEPTNYSITDYEGNTHYINENGSRYDIVVENYDGSLIFIEVKSTRTSLNQADNIALPISTREWRFRDHISDNHRYYLARVFNVELNPEGHFLHLMGVNGFRN